VNNEQTVYDLKLEAIDNYLLVSGWTKVGPNNWKPPAQIALALRHHAPAWKRGPPSNGTETYAKRSSVHTPYDLRDHATVAARLVRRHRSC
jgi:hypothetical protein